MLIENSLFLVPSEKGPGSERTPLASLLIEHTPYVYILSIKGPDNQRFFFRYSQIAIENFTIFGSLVATATTWCPPTPFAALLIENIPKSMS